MAGEESEVTRGVLFFGSRASLIKLKQVKESKIQGLEDYL
jgi:hypothetical protein